MRWKGDPGLSGWAKVIKGPNKEEREAGRSETEI